MEGGGGGGSGGGAIFWGSGHLEGCFEGGEWGGGKSVGGGAGGTFKLTISWVCQNSWYCFGYCKNHG